MDKKFLFIIGGSLIVIVILIVVLLSIGGNKQNPTQTAKISNTLTVWNYGEDKTQFDQAIVDFQRQNKNIKVEYVKKTIDEYYADAVDAIASGKGPDVWAIPSDWLPKYHDKLVSLPANYLNSEDRNKSDIEVYQELLTNVFSKDNIIDGQIYGFPVDFETLNLYINTDAVNNIRAELFRQNPDLLNDESLARLLSQGPKNWEEFTKFIKIVTKKDNETITQSGAAIGTDKNVLEANDVLTLIMLQNGAQMTSVDNSLAQFHSAQNMFGGPDFPGTQALRFYTSFADPKSENYTWNNNLTDDVHAFAEGKTAMMFGYNNLKNDFKKINPYLQYESLPVPQIKESDNPVNLIRYKTFTVPRSSQNQALAWNFITRVANLQDGQYQINPLGFYAKNSYIQNNPEVSIIFNSTKTWYKPDPQKSNEIFLNMITQVNTGKDAQTAIEGAAAQITALLQKIKN